MGDSEKQDRFEEAFKRGQEGEVSSFDVWLQNNRFTPNRVDDTFLATYYQNHPEFPPNHRDQLEEIGEYVGFFSRCGGTYHIPIIGPTGIGKSQILATVSQLLGRVADDIPRQLYSANTFGKEGDELDQHFDETVDELRGSDTAVILIDECSKYSRIEHALPRINRIVENCFLLTAWTPERWRVKQDQINEDLPLSKEVGLTPFDEPDTIEALETATAIMSDGKQTLSKTLFKRIHEKSYGIPGLFNKLLIETLRETFLTKGQLGDLGVVDAAVAKLNLEDARERIYNIPGKKMMILKHILLAYDPRGRRPTELVELLDRDKSTISYHLQGLRSDNIVESEKSGRQAFYRVDENLKPLVQIRMAQEGEFHG